MMRNLTRCSTIGGRGGGRVTPATLLRGKGLFRHGTRFLAPGSSSFSPEQGGGPGRSVARFVGTRRRASKSGRRGPREISSESSLWAAEKESLVTLALLRETYHPWERRAPLTPDQVRRLLLQQQASPGSLRILVQPCPRRIFTAHEYQAAGAWVQEDISGADLVLGVKRPADGPLTPSSGSFTTTNNNTHLFFSHTIKGQPANMPLLQHVLQHHIQLIDYECMTVNPTDTTTPDKSVNRPAYRPQRLVSFGKLAGMAGVLDALSMLGRQFLLQPPRVVVPPAWSSSSSSGPAGSTKRGSSRPPPAEDAAASGWGWSTPFLTISPAVMQTSLALAQEQLAALAQVMQSEAGWHPPVTDTFWPAPTPRPEPLVLCVTGQGGAVFQGAMDLLQRLPHQIISVSQLAGLFDQENRSAADRERDRHQIYLLPVGWKHVVQRRPDHGETPFVDDFDRQDFQQAPHWYRSTFAQTIAPYITVLIHGMYWDARFPRLLTKKQIRRLFEQGIQRLLLVADISCDIHGSMEFLDRTTTIEQPFFHYDPLAEQAISWEEDGSSTTNTTNNNSRRKTVAVLGVDILPTELPRESSEHFGEALLPVVEQLIQARRKNQQAGLPGIDVASLPTGLADAVITTPDGNLMPGFKYLQTLMDRGRTTAASPQAVSQPSITISLEGHLFDSGLINQVADVVENHECGLEFMQCLFPPTSRMQRTKSSVVLRISGSEELKLAKIKSKIRTLVDLIEKADATMTCLDHDQIDDTTSKNETVVVESPSPKKRILVLGAGHVSKSCVGLLGRSTANEITVVSDKEEDAREVAKAATNGRHVGLDVVNDLHRLSDMIEDADLVISLLPASMHTPIALECVACKTHLVTASYESEEMKKLGDRAREAGVVLLNEVGLDPGLDHMSAMRIIHDIQRRGGVVNGFYSVCGGLPAPEAANNPLTYKFSWNPRGVIRASQSGARYLQEGTVIQIHGHDLLQSATPFTDSWPDLDLECLPNRDALKYEESYGIHGARSIFRGTLRYRGFSQLMNTFQNMGLFKSLPVGADTWPQQLDLQRMQGGFSDMNDFLLACSREDTVEAQRALSSLRWLGMLGEPSIDLPTMEPSKATVDAFCEVLERRLRYEDGERDMVVMHHKIVADFHDSAKEEVHFSSLQVFGDTEMTAMTKTVGYTAAAAASLLLTEPLAYGAGLILPTTSDIYEPILALVAEEGIVFQEKVQRLGHLAGADSISQ